jgi:hypothetical protein
MKLNTDNNSKPDTPINTMRLQRALLSVANDDDRKSWDEEKELLKAEHDITKGEKNNLETELQKLQAQMVMQFQYNYYNF